jgi:hypothetical protein
MIHGRQGDEAHLPRHTSIIPGSSIMLLSVPRKRAESAPSTAR